ncbi:YecA family protein [Fictibacillus iocasae]|uniref:YecA family protein n=1 Tax=Fictibacillus iocasae TaxID=2715437 RepID=A0ABW2NV57_9BACL
MQKLGRNDVCFCGSGKKFKKCCLHAEEIVLEMKGHHEGLIKYALDHYQPVLAERTTKFVAQYPVEKEHEQTFANISVCWDVFCTPLQDGKTITELYFEQKLPSMSPETADIAKSWSHAAPSLYTIEGYETDAHLLVKDAFTEKGFTVHISSPQKPSQGALLLGTLVNNGSTFEFYIGYVEIPENELPMLKEKILTLTGQGDVTDTFRYKFPAVLQIALGDNAEKSESNLVTAEDSLSPVLLLVKQYAEPDVYKHAARLWTQFMHEANPIIRKEEVFSAALDYYITKDILGISATQAAVAKKYSVSPGSLSSRYREMKSVLSAVTA